MTRKTLNEYFVVTPPGFENLCVGELEDLQLAPGAPLPGGVPFRGSLRELYLANLWLRSASRILVRLGTVTARDFPTLFQRLALLPWGRFVKPGQGCSFRVTSRSSRLVHSARIAETCREAIAKALGEACPEGSPGATILLRLEENCCLVSIDSSGEHLHRRGYCLDRGKAPLRENLAAGCLLASGYDGSRPLIDPMAGSGTFLSEAALIALNRAPGRWRRFAFMDWPKYRPGLWRQLLDEAARQEKAELPALISGNDKQSRAIEVARRNLAAIGLQAAIELQCGRLQQLTAPAAEGLLICNPPYGGRLGAGDDLAILYRDIGRLWRERFAGWQMALLCPPGVLPQSTGLALDPALKFRNGGLKVVLWQKVPEKP